MSASLMSCVRENSPPMEDARDPNAGPNASELQGAALTTTNNLTSTPLTAADSATATNTEQKRRRFHPLRNLRRIFRRRTITSVADTPTSALPQPTSSTSEKNLRSATLASISSAVTASSPSSPLTQQQLLDTYSQSLPKSKSYSTGENNSSSSSGATVCSKPSHRDVLLTLAVKSQKQQQQQQEQLESQAQKEYDGDSNMYTTTQLYRHPSHASHSSSRASSVHREVGGGVDLSGIRSGLFQPTPALRQTLSVAVMPNAMNRSFYAERQKLRSIGDSSQDLDSSGNDSGSATGGTNSSTAQTTSNGGGNLARTNGDMSDSQRSLSEGRLVDSDYCHEALSQSHDSVFSESASASIFSNREYQAELSDVLRKRNRNRPDASEEDLGLPRSPASPQRRVEQSQRNQFTAAHSSGHSSNAANTASNTTGNQSEVSSLSLLSMNSADGEEFLAASTANNSLVNAETVQERSASSVNRFLRSATFSSSSVSSDMYRHSTSGSFGGESHDEVDVFSADCQRLSHSAARHKMSLRPTKKKGPSRQHRRTLENSIPEANEDGLKLSGSALLDTIDNNTKVRTRSLPPSVNAKTLEQLSDTPKKHTARPAIPSKTAIAAAAGDSTLNSKRTKLEKPESSNAVAKATSITSGSTTSSTPSITNLFSLRSLSGKPSATSDSPKESSKAPTTTTNGAESAGPETSKAATTTSTTTGETAESGFLRRLMTRNSKRSIARVTAGCTDELDLNQSEPKKLQISTSCYDVKQTPNIVSDQGSVLEKSKSAMSYDQSVEETRKEIKREIMSVGSTGLNAMFMISTPSSCSSDSSTINIKETLPLKPKSGAAARQRYLPQDFGSLERKLNNTASKCNVSPTKELCGNSSATSTSSILSKHTQQETFQSTSIIREITASQTSSNSSLTSRSEHHFEKKPKIVGLSAFQQKITRSNESFGRTSTSTSTNSLDMAGDALGTSEQQNQRKAVEKSRSFRTYQEGKPATATMHNNMPSLPDLSLNLRVPCFAEFILHDKEYSSPSPPEPAHDKSNSLGFEINDNNLVKPAARAESTGQLHAQQQHSSNSYSKNVIVNKATPTKLLTPAGVMSSLSPSNSCNKNLSEIEQNIDLLVKSPFISVLRKSTGTNTHPPPNSSSGDEDRTPKVASPTKKPDEKPPLPKYPAALVSVVPVAAAPETERPRPKVLHFKQPVASPSSAPSSPAHPEEKTTPTTAAVQLRDKLKLTSPANGRITMHVPAAKEPDTKSPSDSNNKANSFKSRRSSSVLDSNTSSDEANGTSSSDDVPEFMKIQLNRVDPARIAKSSNVVLAKNVKESPTTATVPTPTPVPTPASTPISPKEPNGKARCSSIEDLCLRRLSNESVDISENDATPEADRYHEGIFEAINKKSKMPGANNARHSAELPPKSPVKKSPKASSPTDGHEAVVLRVKPADAPAPEVVAKNKLSLLERKRLFLQEDKSKTDKKADELRGERKKSIGSEVYRKSFTRSEEKLETVETTPPENGVVLRKKSFSNATQPSATASPAISSSNNNNKDDATPELMKVFARRSLKIKDEDLSTLAEKITQSSTNTSSGGGASKRFVPTQQNVDSDKENQSASEEKLDKLPKIETPLEPAYNGGKLSAGSNGHGAAVISNRNSVADFRHTALKGGLCSNGLSLSNGSNGHLHHHHHHHHNNNNNHGTGNANAGANNGGGGSSAKAFLPPIKLGAFRTMPIERKSSIGGKLQPPAHNSNGTATAATESHNNNNHALSNNNNTNNNNQHGGKAKKFEHSVGGVGGGGGKTIERSATVGEFKGIHQRRAEWEQRAKEALK